MAKGSKVSLGCLFWIAVILLVAVLFLFNQNTIATVIARFQNASQQSSPAPSVEPIPENETPSHETPSAGGDDDIAAAPASPIPTPSSEVNKERSSPPPSPSPAVALNKKERTSKLYFVASKGNEPISLTVVDRPILHDNAPLTETLNALLKGPTAQESKKSLISLIPKGSKVSAVNIKGDTAFINFNEEFRFNEYGVPGLVAQVKQIVFTTTEFPNIQRVQILINGKKVNYLAQEGIFIGVPLTRNSF